MAKKTVKTVDPKVEILKKVTKEQRLDIDDLLSKDRNVEHISLLLDLDEKLVEEVAKVLQPTLFPEEDDEPKRPKSQFLGMMTSRDGMAIMSPAGSEVSDDVRDRSPQRIISRMAKNAIWHPLGGSKGK